MKDAAALPPDLAAAHAMILSDRAARLEAEAAAARALAVNRSTDRASGICSTLMINSYHFYSMRKCRHRGGSDALNFGESGGLEKS
jgi:hypothetical protein